MKKPIKIFYGELSGRFYASAHYKEDGKCIVITGEKFDVTNDIGAAIEKYDITFKKVKE
jgi:hypothetical protein